MCLGRLNWCGLIPKSLGVCFVAVVCIITGFLIIFLGVILHDPLPKNPFTTDEAGEFVYHFLRLLMLILAGLYIGVGIIIPVAVLLRSNCFECLSYVLGVATQLGIVITILVILACTFSDLCVVKEELTSFAVGSFVFFVVWFCFVGALQDYACELSRRSWFMQCCQYTHGNSLFANPFYCPPRPVKVCPTDKPGSIPTYEYVQEKKKYVKHKENDDICIPVSSDKQKHTKTKLGKSSKNAHKTNKIDCLAREKIILEEEDFPKLSKHYKEFLQHRIKNLKVPDICLGLPNTEFDPNATLLIELDKQKCPEKEIVVTFKRNDSIQYGNEILKNKTKNKKKQKKKGGKDLDTNKSSKAAPPSKNKNKSKLSKKGKSVKNTEEVPRGSTKDSKKSRSIKKKKSAAPEENTSGSTTDSDSTSSDKSEDNSKNRTKKKKSKLTEEEITVSNFDGLISEFAGIFESEKKGKKKKKKSLKMYCDNDLNRKQTVDSENDVCKPGETSYKTTLLLKPQVSQFTKVTHNILKKLKNEDELRIKKPQNTIEHELVKLFSVLNTSFYRNPKKMSGLFSKNPTQTLIATSSLESKFSKRNNNFTECDSKYLWKTYSFRSKCRQAKNLVAKKIFKGTAPTKYKKAKRKSSTSEESNELSDLSERNAHKRKRKHDDSCESSVSDICRSYISKLLQMPKSAANEGSKKSRPYKTPIKEKHSETKRRSTRREQEKQLTTSSESESGDLKRKPVRRKPKTTSHSDLSLPDYKERKAPQVSSSYDSEDEISRKQKRDTASKPSIKPKPKKSNKASTESLAIEFCPRCISHIQSRSSSSLQLCPLCPSLKSGRSRAALKKKYEASKIHRATKDHISRSQYNLVKKPKKSSDNVDKKKKEPWIISQPQQDKKENIELLINNREQLTNNREQLINSRNITTNPKETWKVPKQTSSNEELEASASLKILMERPEYSGSATLLTKPSQPTKKYEYKKVQKLKNEYHSSTSRSESLPIFSSDPQIHSDSPPPTKDVKTKTQYKIKKQIIDIKEKPFSKSPTDTKSFKITPKKAIAFPKTPDSQESLNSLNIEPDQKPKYNPEQKPKYNPEQKSKYQSADKVPWKISKSNNQKEKPLKTTSSFQERTKYESLYKPKKETEHSLKKIYSWDKKKNKVHDGGLISFSHFRRSSQNSINLRSEKLNFFKGRAESPKTRKKNSSKTKLKQSLSDSYHDVLSKLRTPDSLQISEQITGNQKHSKARKAKYKSKTLNKHDNAFRMNQLLLDNPENVTIKPNFVHYKKSPKKESNDDDIRNTDLTSTKRNYKKRSQINEISSDSQENSTLESRDISRHRHSDSEDNVSRTKHKRLLQETEQNLFDSQETLKGKSKSLSKRRKKKEKVDSSDSEHDNSVKQRSSSHGKVPKLDSENNLSDSQENIKRKSKSPSKNYKQEQQKSSDSENDSISKKKSSDMRQSYEKSSKLERTFSEENLFDTQASVKKKTRNSSKRDIKQNQEEKTDSENDISSKQRSNNISKSHETFSELDSEDNLSDSQDNIKKKTMNSKIASKHEQEVETDSDNKTYTQLRSNEVSRLYKRVSNNEESKKKKTRSFPKKDKQQKQDESTDSGNESNIKLKSANTSRPYEKVSKIENAFLDSEDSQEDRKNKTKLISRRHARQENDIDTDSEYESSTKQRSEDSKAHEKGSSLEKEDTEENLLDNQEDINKPSRSSSYRQARREEEEDKTESENDSDTKQKSGYPSIAFEKVSKSDTELLDTEGNLLENQEYIKKKLRSSSKRQARQEEEKDNTDSENDSGAKQKSGYASTVYEKVSKSERKMLDTEESVGFDNQEDNKQKSRSYSRRQARQEEEKDNTDSENDSGAKQKSGYASTVYEKVSKSERKMLDTEESVGFDNQEDNKQKSRSYSRRQARQEEEEDNEDIENYSGTKQKSGYASTAHENVSKSETEMLDTEQSIFDKEDNKQKSRSYSRRHARQEEEEDNEDIENYSGTKQKSGYASSAHENVSKLGIEMLDTEESIFDNQKDNKQKSRSYSRRQARQEEEGDNGDIENYSGTKQKSGYASTTLENVLKSETDMLDTEERIFDNQEDNKQKSKIYVRRQARKEEEEDNANIENNSGTKQKSGNASTAHANVSKAETEMLDTEESIFDNQEDIKQKSRRNSRKQARQEEEEDNEDIENYSGTKQKSGNSSTAHENVSKSETEMLGAEERLFVNQEDTKQKSRTYSRRQARQEEEEENTDSENYSSSKQRSSDDHEKALKLESSFDSNEQKQKQTHNYEKNEVLSEYDENTEGKSKKSVKDAKQKYSDIASNLANSVKNVITKYGSNDDEEEDDTPEQYRLIHTEGHETPIDEPGNQLDNQEDSFKTKYAKKYKKLLTQFLQKNFLEKEEKKEEQEEHKTEEEQKKEDEKKEEEKKIEQDKVEQQKKEEGKPNEQGKLEHEKEESNLGSRENSLSIFKKALRIVKKGTGAKSRASEEYIIESKVHDTKKKMQELDGILSDNYEYTKPKLKRSHYRDRNVFDNEKEVKIRRKAGRDLQKAELIYLSSQENTKIKSIKRPSFEKNNDKQEIVPETLMLLSYNDVTENQVNNEIKSRKSSKNRKVRKTAPDSEENRNFMHDYKKEAKETEVIVLTSQENIRIQSRSTMLEYQNQEKNYRTKRKKRSEDDKYAILNQINTTSKLINISNKGQTEENSLTISESIKDEIVLSAKELQEKEMLPSNQERNSVKSLYNQKQITLQNITEGINDKGKSQSPSHDSVKGSQDTESLILHSQENDVNISKQFSATNTVKNLNVAPKKETTYDFKSQSKEKEISHMEKQEKQEELKLVSNIKKEEESPIIDNKEDHVKSKKHKNKIEPPENQVMASDKKKRKKIKSRSASKKKEEDKNITYCEGNIKSKIITNNVENVVTISKHESKTELEKPESPTLVSEENIKIKLRSTSKKKKRGQAKNTRKSDEDTENKNVLEIHNDTVLNLNNDSAREIQNPELIISTAQDNNKIKSRSASQKRKQDQNKSIIDSGDDTVTTAKCASAIVLLETNPVISDGQECFKTEKENSLKNEQPEQNKNVFDSTKDTVKILQCDTIESNEKEPRVSVTQENHDTKSKTDTKKRIKERNKTVLTNIEDSITSPTPDTFRELQVTKPILIDEREHSKVKSKSASKKEKLKRNKHIEDTGEDTITVLRYDTTTNSHEKEKVIADSQKNYETKPESAPKKKKQEHVKNILYDVEGTAVTPVPDLTRGVGNIETIIAGDQENVKIKSKGAFKKEKEDKNKIFIDSGEDTVEIFRYDTKIKPLETETIISDKRSRRYSRKDKREKENTNSESVKNSKRQSDSERQSQEMKDIQLDQSVSKLNSNFKTEKEEKVTLYDQESNITKTAKKKPQEQNVLFSTIQENTFTNLKDVFKRKKLLLAEERCERVQSLIDCQHNVVNTSENAQKSGKECYEQQSCLDTTENNFTKTKTKRVSKRHE